MARTLAPNLPNWPALMPTWQAAQFLSLGEASFRALAARERLLPVELGANAVRWRKRDLEALVAALPHRDDEPGVPSPTGSMFDEALARVRQGQRRTR